MIKTDIVQEAEKIASDFASTSDFTISEAIKRLKSTGYHISERIVRYIESKYKYILPKRDESSGYRLYTKDDITNIATYLYFRALNLSRKKISRFFELEHTIKILKDCGELRGNQATRLGLLKEERKILALEIKQRIKFSKEMGKIHLDSLDDIIKNQS